MKFLKSAKLALNGEAGSSNVEIIVWISVVLVIATVLFAFRDQITKFISGAGKEVGSFKTK